MTSTSIDGFEAEQAPSNKCGFTLMNNQTGNVVAEVMDENPDLTVTALPAMIRVDGGRRIDVNYADIADALGESEFDTANFEEVMSTHYGRMVHGDEGTIFFANPEDAAEYLGFDLTVAE